jgi:hypothetical protein
VVRRRHYKATRLAGEGVDLMTERQTPSGTLANDCNLFGVATEATNVLPDLE